MYYRIAHNVKLTVHDSKWTVPEFWYDFLPDFFGLMHGHSI